MKDLFRAYRRKSLLTDSINVTWISKGLWEKFVTVRRRRRRRSWRYVMNRKQICIFTALLIIREKKEIVSSSFFLFLSFSLSLLSRWRGGEKDTNDNMKDSYRSILIMINSCWKEIFSIGKRRIKNRMKILHFSIERSFFFFSLRKFDEILGMCVFCLPVSLARSTSSAWVNPHINSVKVRCLRSTHSISVNKKRQTFLFDLSIALYLSIRTRAWFMWDTFVIDQIN